MEGCRFCKALNDKNEANDSLMVGDISLPSGAKVFSYDIFIEDDTVVAYLDDMRANPMFRKKLKINFCPLCGRRLIKKGE